jgi:hypothetical protein
METREGCMNEEVTAREGGNSNVTKAICESLVIIELLRKAWHVVNLNAVNNTPNADLIAIKGDRRITIQVKGTDGGVGRPFRHHVSFSRTCTKYLNERQPFFNSKTGPVSADFFIGVTQAAEILPTFLIMPIDDAEKMARQIADWWYDVPKLNGERRSPNFASMVAIRLEGVGNTHPEQAQHYQMTRRFINAWDVLET